jgi:hypothetical protein
MMILIFPAARRTRAVEACALIALDAGSTAQYSTSNANEALSNQRSRRQLKQGEVVVIDHAQRPTEN